MKKQILITLTVISINLLISCNSKTSNTKEKISSSTEQTETKLTQEETKSNAKLSFQFNRESFQQSETQQNTSAGMRTNDTDWLIVFNGESTDKSKEAGLQFRVKNFKLETGIVSVSICTISLFGFEESGITEAALYSKEGTFLEITSIKKIKSESSMGTTLTEYSINGNFYGNFGTLTGEKNYKVDNGTFENYKLVEITKS